MKTRRPQVPAGHPTGDVARLAAQLREGCEGSLDDVSLARMERSLLQAWRAKASHLEPFPHRRRSRTSTTWFFAAAVAGAAALGAALGLLLLDHGEAKTAALGGAQFEMRLGDGAVQRGQLHEGQTLESGRYGTIQVDVGRTRVDVEPGARVRFDRMSQHHIQITVIEGAIGAQFNPEHEGERYMAVETRAARVVVVGTRFSVAVDGQSNTRVAVREGIVDVLPRDGKRQRLTAGQEFEVLLDPGDATERAVREAIAAQLESATMDGLELETEADVEPEVDDNKPSQGVAEARPRSASSVDGRSWMPSAERRLELARDLLRDGRHQAARKKLRLLANAASIDALHRAEALTLIAESFTAQGHVPRAEEAYREAANVAPDAPAGHNAVFALARLLERYTHDTSGAVSAYERYLVQAPRGALAGQARRALCRLGQEERCEQNTFGDR